MGDCNFNRIEGKILNKKLTQTGNNSKKLILILDLGGQFQVSSSRFGIFSLSKPVLSHNCFENWASSIAYACIAIDQFWAMEHYLKHLPEPA